MRISTLSIVLSLLAFKSYAAPHLPHLDLEMSGNEYRNALQNVPFENTMSNVTERAIEVGARNLDWISIVNATRSENEQLKLTSPQTQKGIPIDAPKLYNEEIIATDFKNFQLDALESLSAILLGSAELPTILPVDDDTFLEWSRKMNRIYDTAARWKIMKPHLASLSSRKRNDVRGYFHLKKEENLATQLSSFSSLEQSKKDQLRKWLISICYNNTGIELACSSALDFSIALNSDLNPFYEKHISGGRDMWNSFFRISKKRHDVDWKTTNASIAKVPFSEPDAVEVKQFLLTHIEDEWKWNDWTLKLAFTSSPTSSTPYVELVPGVTANAELAGARIQLDGNLPLTEYAQQWTIRHEFGHTLGFPDCYVEFYDSTDKVIVNYQLDVTNLMCSRQGRLNDVLFSEFKSVYLKQ